MTVANRSVVMVGRACAAVALGAGALLAVAGPASAAPVAPVASAVAQAPTGDPCPPGHKYTTTVGGVDGCNSPPSGKELGCYKGAAKSGGAAAARAARQSKDPRVVAGKGALGAARGCATGAAKAP